MSDGKEMDDAVASVMEVSKEPITITIKLYPNGRLETEMPNNIITALGMLELAKSVVVKPEPKPNIVIPQIEPKRPM